jgi:hypothetical protein
MLNKEIYDIMKKQYWKVWSWAIWWAQKTTPRSNTDDMTWVNDPNLLWIINTWYVFVWLNWSSTHWDKWAIDNVDWANFHSGYSLQNDYKLRYALKDTKYRGSYLTDLIKFYPEVNSSKVGSYLKKNLNIVKNNIESFEKEISYLWKDIKIIAMGTKTYNLLNKYLWKHYQIFLIKHYSYRIWKENYRKEVLSVLE